jgi:hypothetical protein
MPNGAKLFAHYHMQQSWDAYYIAAVRAGQQQRQTKSCFHSTYIVVGVRGIEQASKP